MSKVEVASFYDEASSTLSHVVHMPATRAGILIDPVMDFNLQTFATSRTSIDVILKYCREKDLSISHIFETHAHADHLSGSQLVKEAFPLAKIGIGQEITKVQKHFAKLFDLGPQFPCDGSQFDFLYKNAKEIDVGEFAVRTWHTPGHTPACYTLQIEDCLFVGDLIFAPDLGTGRCDFPDGDAAALFRSVTTQIYTHPDETRIYLGHDYPDKRPLCKMVSVGDQKRSNVRLNATTNLEDFVRARVERDRQLAPPKLILPSLLVNIQAGRLPSPHANGKSYMNIPLNVL